MLVKIRKIYIKIKSSLLTSYFANINLHVGVLVDACSHLFQGHHAMELRFWLVYVPELNVCPGPEACPDVGHLIALLHLDSEERSDVPRIFLVVAVRLDLSLVLLEADLVSHLRHLSPEGVHRVVARLED